jgi:HSP20 family protein
MANLFKKEPTTVPAVSWDPFQEMRSLMNWEPFRALRPNLTEGQFMPAFEVKETKDGFLFKADLPGVKESDLEVQLVGDRLTISGKREAEKTEEKDTIYTYERSFGSFLRTFTMPTGIDAEHVKAELKEGVLTVLVPRLPEMQAKKIAVKSEKTKA